MCVLGETEQRETGKEGSPGMEQEQLKPAGEWEETEKEMVSDAEGEQTRSQGQPVNERWP